MMHSVLLLDLKEQVMTNYLVAATVINRTHSDLYIPLVTVWKLGS